MEILGIDAISGISGIDSRWLATGVVALVAGERLLEVWLSRRNARWVLAHGGREFRAGRHHLWVVLVQSAYLVAIPCEIWLLERPFFPALAAFMLAALLLAMAIRYWAVAALGPRWNIRVLCLPGTPAVTTGPYRFVRHPNYTAMMLEIPALPLIHTAWASALVFTALCALLLRQRLALEEMALARCSDYEPLMSDRPRFWPRLRSLR